MRFLSNYFPIFCLSFNITRTQKKKILCSLNRNRDLTQTRPDFENERGSEGCLSRLCRFIFSVEGWIVERRQAEWELVARKHRPRRSLHARREGKAAWCCVARARQTALSDPLQLRWPARRHWVTLTFTMSPRSWSNKAHTHTTHTPMWLPSL